MISVEFAVAIHDDQVATFGGATGIRDLSVLESALGRPYATFGGEDLLPDPILKAAAILESIAINHPFMDGNKRTAWELMIVVLDDYDLDVVVDEQERYRMVIAVASGELRFDGIVEWLRQHTAPI